MSGNSGALNQFVSVIAPCRNERDYVDAFCDQVFAQQLPPGWRLEVLVADGRSDDGTRERLEVRANADDRLILVDNAGRIASAGLNACLARARGTVIVRMDIHTTFAPDYVLQCMAALEHTGADNVGGPWIARGKDAMSQAIAAAFQCPWVVGGARSRDVSYEGEVDTVYLGCWPRASFERFGLFDEALVRNQDDEHNLRIRRKGGRVWQSPAIRSIYQPRGSLGALFAQQRQYGYWRPFVMKKHRQPGSLRQLVPMGFVAAVLLSVLISPWSAGPLVALFLVYGLYLLKASWKAGSNVHNLLRLPAVIAAYHFGYGIGTWQGFGDLILGRRAAQSQTRLTR